MPPRCFILYLLVRALWVVVVISLSIAFRLPFRRNPALTGRPSSLDQFASLVSSRMIGTCSVLVYVDDETR